MGGCLPRGAGCGGVPRPRRPRGHGAAREVNFTPVPPQQCLTSPYSTHLPQEPADRFTPRPALPSEGGSPVETAEAAAARMAGGSEHEVRAVCAGVCGCVRSHMSPLPSGQAVRPTARGGDAGGPRVSEGRPRYAGGVRSSQHRRRLPAPGLTPPHAPSVAGSARPRQACLHGQTSPPTSTACSAATRTRWPPGASCTGSSATPATQLKAAGRSRRARGGSRTRKGNPVLTRPVILPYAVCSRRRLARSVVCAPFTAHSPANGPQRAAGRRHCWACSPLASSPFFSGSAACARFHARSSSSNSCNCAVRGE